MPEGLETEIERLIQTDVPVVLFDRYVPDLKSDYVIVDNSGSTYKATQHLIENGYRNIAFVTIDTDLQQMIDRLNGYKQALMENELIPTVIHVSYKDDISGADQLASSLFGTKKFDAVIFAANYICLDGLRAMRNLGIKMHGDIAVVAFDDFELLEFCNPQVTAIEQPLAEIAENVMKR